MSKPLIGYGGGGGGNSARTPVEGPDTLKSLAYARMLDLLCEGEIEGFADADALKCIYLDGVPIKNPDGTPNFKGVAAYGVYGTQSQEYIPGFVSAQAEVAVDTEVTAAMGPSGLVRRITDATVDAVHVLLEVPALSKYDEETGSLQPTDVEVEIALQSNGGGYVLQPIGGYLWGKCSTPYQRGFRVELTGAAPWDVRVRRLTPDSTQQTLSNKTVWRSYTVMQDEKLSYPNSALVALQLPAHQFQGGGVPTRSYRVRGLRVRVPSNYNPATRAYTGTWDGTFQVAWTDNPAWCFYDLLTTKRYGLGQHLNASAVDKWGLYEVGRYCDELVPDGAGGMEPRFRCNLYLQTQEDAYRVVNALASIFRAMVYWASGAVAVAQDAPRDAEYLFTCANVLDGRFTYAGSGKRARHTVALVTWNDPDNHFKQAVEYVADEEGLALNGYNPTEVVALGCTSRGQAVRAGKWLLYTERLETETVTFRTGLEGALRNPGAIIQVQDAFRAGRRLGGRLVRAAASSVELDADVQLEAGKTYRLSVVLPDGSVAERDVASPPGTFRTLALALPLALLPQAQAVWVLTASDLAPQSFRVVSVSEVERGQYEVTALKHHPGKFAEVELGVKTQTPPTSLTPSTVPPAGLVVGEGLYLAVSGEVKPRLTAAWTQVPRATSYVVRWREAGGGWQTQEGVPTHYWELNDANAGTTYEVQVAAALNGFVTGFVAGSHLVQGKALPPSNVSGLVATLKGLTASLAWAEIPDLDRDMYELRFGGASWNAASFIGRVRGTAFEWGLPPGAGTYLLRVKALDSSGNYSVADATVTLNTAPTTPATLTMSVSDAPPA